MNSDTYFNWALICFGIAVAIFFIILPFMQLNAEMEAKAFEYCASHETPECQEWLARLHQRYR